MMRCFLPCFGASKRPRHLPPPHQTRVADEHVKRQPAEQEILGEPISDAQPVIELEKQSTKMGIKKVTHDLNPNANEELSAKEVTKLEESTAEPEKTQNEVTPHENCGPEATSDSLKDENEGDHEEEDEVNRKSLPAESSESLFSLSVDSRKHVCGPEATSDSLKDENEGDHEEEDEVNRKSLPAESSESLFSLSVDSRKHVCGPEATSDSLKDENEGDHEEEDEVNRKSLPAESSESLFSLSVDSRKHVSAAEKSEYEVDGPMPPGDAPSNTNEGSGSFWSRHDGVRRMPVKAEENLAQEMPVKVKDSPDLFIIKLDVTSTWNAKRKVNFDLKVNTNEEPSAQQLISGLNKSKQDQDETPQVREYPGSVASRKSSYISRYRYQDCSDEECGDFDLSESDFGDKFADDDDAAENDERGEGAINGTCIQEESSESLFSLSIDSRKQVSGAEKAENEVNSPMPSRGTESFVGRGERIQNVSSVLNPIENIVQGRVEKATAMQPLKYEKKNINSEKDITGTPKSGESSLKVSNGKARSKKLDDENQEEIGVNTSLSSWLVETETMPDSKNGTNSVGASTPISKRSSLSPMSHEDRPILGALSLEELRKFSASSKPSRGSKSRSPDETPIIGTVGSYWSYTGQTVNSESPGSWGRIQKQRGTH